MTTKGQSSSGETEVERLRKKVKNLNLLLSKSVPSKDVAKLEGEFAKWKTRSRELNKSRFKKIEDLLQIREKRIKDLETQIAALDAKVLKMQKQMDAAR